MEPSDPSRSSLPPELPVATSIIWNRVLGIICIVFGAGAALYAIGSTIGQKAMVSFSERQMEISGADPAVYRALMDKWSGTLMLIGVATAIVALVLLAGGILLLLRRRLAAVVLKTWAALKILLLAVTTPAMAAFQKANMEVAFSGALAGEGAEVAAMSGRVAQVIGIGVAVVWGTALPIVILVWFSRKKIKEQVAFWN